MPKFDPIDYVMQFGGRCRDCADEDGVCPSTGLPCVSADARKAIGYVLRACAFGVEHGWMDDPFIAAYLKARGAVLGTWKPISEADNGIAHILDAAGLHIGNSLPIWVRDSDGRIFECLWADDGKRAYWWDIEGESPVDPVEFMPHPLASLSDNPKGAADAL